MIVYKNVSKVFYYIEKDWDKNLNVFLLKYILWVLDYY